MKCSGQGVNLNDLHRPNGVSTIYKKASELLTVFFPSLKFDAYPAISFQEQNLQSGFIIDAVNCIQLRHYMLMIRLDHARQL